MITMLDPPEHTALRVRLRRWFTPARLRALEPRVREIVADILDGLAPGLMTRRPYRLDLVL